MLSRGAPAINAVSAGRVPVGGRRIGTAPPGIATVRHRTWVAGPLGVCGSHGSSWPGPRMAPAAGSPPIAKIRLPDFKRPLLRADVIRNIFGSDVYGVRARGKTGGDHDLAGVGFHGAVPMKRGGQSAV